MLFALLQTPSLPRLACLTLGLVLLGGCGGSGSSSSSSSGSGATNGGSAAASSVVASIGELALVSQVSGWASQGTGTTGGAGATPSNTYVVHNYTELRNALSNVNSPNYVTNPTAAALEPKMIYIVGTIWGTELSTGGFANEAYYKSLNTTAAKWDWDLYVKSQRNDYMADLNARAAAGDVAATDEKTRMAALSSARTTLSNLQKAQIQFVIPSNTSIIGVGADAKLVDGFFSINATSNIVIRNLEFQAPLDLTPAYTNTVGKEEWNARFKALSVVTGKQLWIDHCTFSDGAYFDNAEVLTLNNVTKEVQRHDGLLDIEDSSDYITVSYSVFKNHDKTSMVGGSGDGNGTKERAYNRLTFSHNLWENSTQRAPRARFGQIHVYNNYYRGSTDSSTYKTSYYIGMGAESRILSEGNAFELTGSSASVNKVISNLNGYQFKDVGSWYNGSPASEALENAAKTALEARYTTAQAAGASSGFTVAPYTNELGWTPGYSYQRAATADQLKGHVLAWAGAGKLPTTPAGSTRLQLADAASSTYSTEKVLAGGDAWTPHLINANQANVGRINPATLTADYVVAQDGTGGFTRIQDALNAASVSTASRVNIRVKAGTYDEALIAGAGTAAITLYSTESDATKVIVTGALAQDSTGASYNARVTASTYTGNTDALSAYTACSKKTTSIGKECATTLRVRNNGFTAINMTFQNTWNDANPTGTSQAPAVHIEKVDRVVFDGTRLLGYQDTLYLQNSGKRSYFVAGEVRGDVDFIFGPGAAVFDGVRIQYVGTRKPSGSSIAAPSTLTSQLYGFVFVRCVFLADGSTTDASIYLARQWDDSTDVTGKMIVRDSVLAKHISPSADNSPWNPTPINKSRATLYTSSGETFLGEYRNWSESLSASSTSSSVASSSVSSSSASVSSASSSAAASSSASSTASSTSGGDSLIPGASPLGNAFISNGLPATTSASYASSSSTNSSTGVVTATNNYNLVGAGSLSVGTTVGAVTTYSDSMAFAYTAVSGDFTLTARLTGLEIPSGLSTANVRAGLMVRNSLDAGARYFGLLMRGIPRLQWEQRKNDGENISSSALSPSWTAAPSTTPVWLRLQRTGQTITVSYSSDGVTWTGTKAQDFSATGYTPLGSTVYVGLCGVSGSSSVTATSNFTQVSLQ